MARMIAGRDYVEVISYIEVKKYNNSYKVLSFDLSVAHTDEPLGLGDVLDEAGAAYASYMTIIAVPLAFTFKLNSTENDAIDAVVNLEVEDFEITEIFITNDAGAGTALIEVEYRVD